MLNKKSPVVTWGFFCYYIHMSWAGRRQFYYSFGFLIFVLGVLSLLFYPVIFKAPACNDGKQNGTELGVDCGGECRRFCPFEVSEPIVLWSRIFPISGSTYNLIAYVENQNINASVPDVNYEFKVYDTQGNYIGRREGHTFIPPNQRFAVFEAHFDAGQSTPKNTVFAFTGPFTWLKQGSIASELPIRVDRIVYSEENSSPRLQARIRNDSIFSAPAFDVIAILYNEERNAIGVSKTHLEGLPNNQSAPVVFTWPSLFDETPVTKDIIPQINPFQVKF